MKPIITLLLLLIIQVAQSQQVNTTQWRPEYHFSPQKNWSNDPNGLVYHNNEWHLFYQHNPFENKWGHMSWGHAVSKDLLNWEHLPLAIPEDSVMIYSGCVVIDKKNTSGFGENSMIAIYTADYHGKKESQYLAYSTDNGRTWTKYKQNPILSSPEGMKGDVKDFRDPNVIWHEPTQQWIMTVALPREFKVQFYSSKNLINWTYLSDFGQQGDVRKSWECPALIQLPVSEQPFLSEIPASTAWVLLVSSNGPHQDFVGIQYFIGSFDGKSFKNTNSPETKLYIDYGKDFYAGIPFNNTNQKIILGWMASLQYTDAQPTYPWKGQMTLPREIALKKSKEGTFLVQRPVEDILKSKNWHAVVQMEDMNLEGDNGMTWRNQTSSYMIDIEFEPNGAREFGLKVLQKPNTNQETSVGYRIDNEQLYINRINSGKIISPNFASMDAAPLKMDRGRVKLQVFVDKNTIEVFGNDGEATITSLVYPEEGSFDWQVFSEGGKTKVTKLSVLEWRK